MTTKSKGAACEAGLEHTSCCKSVALEHMEERTGNILPLACIQVGKKA